MSTYQDGTTLDVVLVQGCKGGYGEKGVHPMRGRRVKELANIIRPLVGQSPHHFKNTQQFVDYIHEVKLEPGEVITSYDVKALFTSVPVNPSIAIVQQKLQQDPLLS